MQSPSPRSEPIETEAKKRPFDISAMLLISAMIATGLLVKEATANRRAQAAPNMTIAPSDDFARLGEPILRPQQLGEEDSCVAVDRRRAPDHFVKQRSGHQDGGDDHQASDDQTGDRRGDATRVETLADGRIEGRAQGPGCG